MAGNERLAELLATLAVGEGFTSSILDGCSSFARTSQSLATQLMRILDEEIAVFLAEKEVLSKAGAPVEELVPWKSHEFSGHPHKSDKLKFFATGGRLIED